MHSTQLKLIGSLGSRSIDAMAHRFQNSKTPNGLGDGMIPLTAAQGYVYSESLLLGLYINAYKSCGSL